MGGAAGMVGESDGVRGAGLSILHGVGLETEEFDAGFHAVGVVCATASYMRAVGARGFDARILGNSVLVSGDMLSCAEVGS